MNISSPSLPRLALIAGPTASGKSALALALAERAGGVLINADSAQVCRELRIVTARPDEAEEMRAPHRLYGYRNGARACSAAEWAGDAVREVRAAHSAGKLPILVGGTGLYIRTLLEGIAPVPEIDPAIRAEVRAMAVAEAHAALALEDAGAAATIRPSDTTRVARALEVVRSTGSPLAEWQKQRRGGIGQVVTVTPLVLLPPREWLYERCDERFEKMLSDEGIEEVRSLLARKLDSALPVMRAIGVREIAAFIGGQMDREQALNAGRMATRQYAKRQYTWFSRQPPAEWARFTDPLDCGGLANALARLDADLSR
jgi:tRNA dimethylallyltransferase